MTIADVATGRFDPGALVSARGREWVVLPETRANVLRLRPLTGSEDDATLIHLDLEPTLPAAATFSPPDPARPGSFGSALLLRDALRLKLRAGAGPFRSFGNLGFEPRAYQLVPLLMALRQETIRLLVADDVGVGKTVEAGLIARELHDRGEIDRFVVICPPHLCEQWQQELQQKFHFDAVTVRPGTVRRLERGLGPDESVFDVYPVTVVSLDYIKSDRRRADFLRTCPRLVIVDEAHTCVQANTTTRHQRYRLLKGLAGDGRSPGRHLVLLTATPHSGDETAFHNLLGLLQPDFHAFGELPQGPERRALRQRLAGHFVQRRRGDIAEWKDDTVFPLRESREVTYRLTGAWGLLFEAVMAYARTLVQRAEGGTVKQQRMSWWAALAVLRCVSSSPAAASSTLRTRLEAAGPEDDARAVDELGQETVFDGALADDLLSRHEASPAGALEHWEDSRELRALIERADALRGPKNDPKLKVLLREVRELQKDGFRPVIFCRFIATARYVGEALRQRLGKKTHRVVVLTGELTPEQRREQVEELAELNEATRPVLVATECLSEGVNLQEHFDAVVHYDLTWNPTRLEQREGRADRFGQRSPKVRTVMLYGENNPVDGAVLRVILRKAEKIRRELGVSVPLPTDNNKIVEAILEAVLLHEPSDAAQMRLFNQAEKEVDSAWATVQSGRERSIFSHRRLRPADVLPEWERTTRVLGGPQDVERFVRSAAERLEAPLEQQNGAFRLPMDYLPAALGDRLRPLGMSAANRIGFRPPLAAGARHVHRSDPLVLVLADHVAEGAFGEGDAAVGARVSAAFVSDVKERTVVYLLRLRSQLETRRRNANGAGQGARMVLAEECLGVAVRGTGPPQVLGSDDGSSDEIAQELLSSEPVRNMPNGQKSLHAKQAIAALPQLQQEFDALARRRAEELLADHRRVRDASGMTGIRYSVRPCLPVDVIGVYVLVPAVAPREG